tara:strand:+ start:233 stop:955 length:723 start_codon:yes stop_codon:yes gene_type:complete
MLMTIKFSDSDKLDFDYLLIGNSRLHWALRKDNSYEFFHTLFDQRFPENINFKKLIWASVGQHPTSKLLKENEISNNNFTLKNIPDHIGIDRALACFAAHKIIRNKYKKNILIVDLGTTVSITKIDNKGNLIGGQLLPGFTTQLKSMDENTKNLTFPKNIFIPSNNFETNTFKAMLRGVYNSIFGAIKLSFNPKQDVLIICGGDAKFIGETIRKKIQNIIIEPNLVLYGMIFSRKQANII